MTQMGLPAPILCFIHNRRCAPAPRILKFGSGVGADCLLRVIDISLLSKTGGGCEMLSVVINLTVLIGCNGSENDTYTWLRDCCRQVEAEQTSRNSRNKLHQTTYKEIFSALYSTVDRIRDLILQRAKSGGARIMMPSALFPPLNLIEQEGKGKKCPVCALQLAA